MPPKNSTFGKKRAQEQTSATAAACYDRWVEKLWQRPDFVRKYCLMNNICPWILCPVYDLHESLLRISPRLRHAWIRSYDEAVGGLRCPQTRTLLSRDPETRGKNSPRVPSPPQHKALERERSFRLLQLFPGNIDEPIACASAQYLLGESTPYHAISYAWGTDTQCCKIAFDEQEVMVSQTVHQLLQRMRKDDVTVHLWVDWLCIDQSSNQSSVKEKNRQVSMMGDIYAAADAVDIWLGEEDSETAEIDTLFANLGLEQCAARSEVTNSAPWRLHRCWKYVTRFLGRPWFSRTWVLQEVILAKTAHLRCGSYCWDWSGLSDIFRSLVSETVFDPMGVNRRLSHNLTGFLAFYYRSPKRSLVALLAAARDMQASNPRDKVFGLLSLVENHHVHVDYQLSIVQVYREAAVHCLLDGEVTLLNHAGDAIWNEVQRLPSWVPDWSNSNRPCPLTLQGRDFTASLGCPLSDLKFSKDGNVLELDAYQIGTVRATGIPWSGNVTYSSKVLPDFEISELGLLAHSRLESWRSMLWRWRDSDHTYAPTGESQLDAFARTICADTAADSFQNRSAESVYEDFRDHLYRLWRTGPSRFFSDRDKHTTDAVKKFDEAVKRTCFKRSFFLTKHGYMGLGPFFTRPTDRIFILPGVPTPLILRKAWWADGFYLVGECYIHGLMYGEAACSISQRSRISIL